MAKLVKKVYQNSEEFLFEKPKPPVTYGVNIDTSNSNPDTCVTYTDDLAGVTDLASIDNMDIFKDIKPCLLKNGVRVGYLNKVNYAQWEAGQ